jgi:hypothetical protein
MAMKRRKFDEQAGYRPDRPLFVRSESDLRRELVRTVEARRLIADAPNRGRAVAALSPLRQASAALN